MAHVRELDLLVSDKKQATCHLMPCSIEHNQIEVKAREYFEPTIRELKSGDDDEQGRATRKPVNEKEDEPGLIASFRGRPLLGKKIKVPEGYMGHVIGKGESSSTKIKKHFNEFSYWNWDQIPTKEDPPVKALNWLKVAKSIHDPVE